MVLYMFKPSDEREDEELVDKLVEELFDEEDHECDEHGDADIDICDDCGEHTSFCSQCGLSSCCGAPAIETDYDMEER